MIRQNAWRVFEEVKPDHHYIIGVDAAEGKDGGNHAAACVMDIETHAQVAAFSDTIEPEGFSKEISKAGKYFNEALVAVENEKFGSIVISNLMAYYPNLYYHTIKSTAFKPDRATQFGWSPRYKEEAINRLRVDLGAHKSKTEDEKKKAIKILDKATLVEMGSFIRQKNKTGDGFKMGASRSKMDDLVSALYIANYVWHEVKDWYVQAEEEEDPDLTPMDKLKRKWRENYKQYEYDLQGTDFWTEDENDGMG